jgi:hypothetical protein
MADAAVPLYTPANLHLLPFWCDAPLSWFTTAEAQFRLRNIDGDNEEYLCLIAAVPHDAFLMVVHIVEQEDQADDAYDQLKAALVSSNTMSIYQRIELLSKVEPLDGQKPSDLLATMLEICPSGHEASPFICYLFRQHLPREIRMLLA